MNSFGNLFVNPVLIQSSLSIIVLIMMSSLRGKRSVPAELPLGSSGNKLVTESVTRTTFTETTVSNCINDHQGIVTSYLGVLC